MTEYEYLDLIVSTSDSAGYHATNYIAVMFTYVAVAYFVGQKLTRFQVTVTTALYAVFSPFPCISAYESLVRFRNLNLEYFAEYRPEEPINVVLQHGPDFMIALFVATWIVSIIFMFQARLQSRE